MDADNRTRGAGIPWRELALVAGFYVVFAAFYACSLYFSIPEEYNPQFPWTILYLQYPLKALFTLPIWYLIFRVLRHWSLTAKVALNLLLMPVYVKGWQQTHYFILDTLEIGRLSGSAEWWDIYIPGLFYVLQFGIFHAYDYYTNLQQTRLDKIRAEQLALKSELTALKAQLNPHFLYNTFNTISASVPPGQEYTRELIATLADLFRYQLRATRADLVRLEEELIFVENYLQLEKARYGDRLRMDIAVADSLGAALVPPMLIQPLVENAIRHGIAPLVAGGEVHLSARAINSELEIEIADDGVGADSGALAQSDGFGLANTRRRLDLLYGAALHLESPAAGGLLLRFRIPLTYATESTADRRRGTSAPAPAGIPE